MKDREKAPERLREWSNRSPDPSTDWAVSILRRANRYAPPPGREQRIWANLGTAVAGSGDATSSRRRPRFAFAVSASVLALCFAGATLAHMRGWWGRTSTGAQTERREHSGGLRAGAMRSGAIRAGEPRAASATPATTRPPATSPPAEPESPDESQLLLNAMRALRIDQDAARARTLLVAYLARHPNGELAEEALVMLVEAAVAHGDRDAARLADRYSALYPNGQFAAQVRRTVDGRPASQ